MSKHFGVLYKLKGLNLLIKSGQALWCLVQIEGTHPPLKVAKHFGILYILKGLPPPPQLKVAKHCGVLYRLKELIPTPN